MAGVGDWFVEAGEWLDKYALNKDGSYSLYDNDRFRNKDSWHEQILSVTPSKPSLNTGLGSLALDIYTGGWEWKYANLSLFDFGHAEIGAEFKNNQFSIIALASIWSPSFSFNIFGVEVEIGAEVGSIGADVNIGANGFSIAAAGGCGFRFGIKW